MKTQKITYWTTTGLFAAIMVLSAYMYLTSADIKTAFVHLGFPDYFRVELGIAKFLGAVALIIPMVPARIKEWAYAGFFINLISAVIAHVSTGDPFSGWFLCIVLFAVLVASYVTYHKLHDAK